jgi:hypothetical protein
LLRRGGPLLRNPGGPTRAPQRPFAQDFGCGLYHPSTRKTRVPGNPGLPLGVGLAHASGAMLFSGTSPRFQCCVLGQPLGAGGFRKRGHNHATRAIMSPTTAITHPGMRSIANRSYRCSEGPSVLATATEESSAVSGRTSGRPENRREQPAHAREKYVNPSYQTCSPE